MNTGKIQSLHYERMAYVYVRQSTPWQVKENRESTERQYHLHERALQLGWPASHVEVIDEDQGRTGTFATHRSGFQRLVTEVGLGKVGIVLMLEASRLARNNSDWYRLIEICGLTRTLIGDEQAIYNPREPNDRLLLGVKGTLSEAELFTLRTRLYEGRWNKARKGQLQFPLPTGFARGADGKWELDPDAQVRERLAYVFDSFRRHGVARRVVRDLKQQGLDLPTRVAMREGYGSLIWKPPRLSAVVRILRNPAYAGVYVFGRRGYSGERRSAKTGKVIPHQVPVAQWPVKIDAHHPAYLSWEEYVKNCERLHQNWNGEETRGAAARRQGPVAGDRVLWDLRPQDGSTKPRSAREAIADLHLSIQLQERRDQYDLPKHDLASGGWSDRGSLFGVGFADELRSRAACPGATGAGLRRPTPAAGIATGAGAL